MTADDFLAQRLPTLLVDHTGLKIELMATASVTWSKIGSPLPRNKARSLTRHHVALPADADTSAASWPITAPCLFAGGTPVSAA